ncbi:STAS domain protein [Ancylostoma caninum]|uniref:STAS domain protein n=1 Tax=Ancylostoma caninum TaxID=29170 RepID=A0A368H6W9_ANCCA|nr:STAS domain protein [Ancylostoma caninum]
MFPQVELFSSLILDAISISIVVMAIHVSLSKMLAKKYHYEVNTNQEFYAMGFTSVISGFFPVFPHSSSLSRTIVSANAGTKTQLCAIFSSIFIFVVVQFSGSWLQPLPMCVLGSIIVVALLGMFQKFTQLPRLWRLSKIDFSIWVVAFVATIGIDVMQGLAIAIAFALFTTVIREQWPRWHILANISGTNDFRDVERYRHIYFFNSVCVLRFDSPLLFTNVERFRKIVDRLANDWNNVRCCGKIDKRHLIGEQNEKHETTSDSSHPTKRYLIIDCSGFAYVDVMGVNSLKEIYEEMRERNIKVSFAAAKAPVRELFEASGLYAAVAKTNFYPTIYDAVSYAQLEQSTSHMDEIALDENSYENNAVDTTDETIRTSDTPNTPEKSDKSDARQSV